MTVDELRQKVRDEKRMRELEDLTFGTSIRVPLEQLRARPRRIGQGDWPQYRREAVDE